MANTLSHNHDSLLRALDCLDRKTTKLFFGFPECLIPVFKQYYLKCDIPENQFQADPTVWFHISQEKANALELK